MPFHTINADCSSSFKCLLLRLGWQHDCRVRCSTAVASLARSLEALVSCLSKAAVDVSVFDGLGMFAEVGSRQGCVGFFRVFVCRGCGGL
eukprot:8527229-Prorocentrum_lima.AAC.1